MDLYCSDFTFFCPSGTLKKNHCQGPPRRLMGLSVGSTNRGLPGQA